MPAVPQTKATWTSGVDPLNSTNLHAFLRDPIRFLMSIPAAELRATSTQSIPSGSFTSLLFQVETLDSDVDAIGGHSTSVNTSRYTARYPGWYRVSASFTWGSSATGRRGGRYAVNGTSVPGSAVLQAAGIAAAVTSVMPSMLVRLEEGDYLEVAAFQDSGGSLSTLNSSDNQSRMTVEWSRL